MLRNGGQFFDARLLAFDALLVVLVLVLDAPVAQCCPYLLLLQPPAVNLVVPADPSVVVNVLQNHVVLEYFPARPCSLPHLLPPLVEGPVHLVAAAAGVYLLVKLVHGAGLFQVVLVRYSHDPPSHVVHVGAINVSSQ